MSVIIVVCLMVVGLVFLVISAFYTAGTSRVNFCNLGLSFWLLAEILSRVPFGR